MMDCGTLLLYSGGGNFTDSCTSEYSIVSFTDQSSYGSDRVVYFLSCVDLEAMDIFNSFISLCTFEMRVESSAPSCFLFSEGIGIVVTVKLEFSWLLACSTTCSSPLLVLGTICLLIISR
eukprot:m.148329 g.148329  ORF g.148329 m.148329 type:complete len:120 (+) comp13254_c1_seq1:190-549(+)